MENKIKKQSMGRQKIEIKKIEKKSYLQVTFSKRRTGLFKKVADLTTLYGCEAVVLVKSPGGKLFAFGNPSVEEVINRYTGLNKVDHNCAEVNVVCTNMYEEAMKKLKAEKELEELKRGDLFWWKKSVDDMGLQELEEFRDGLQNLKSNIMSRVNQMSVLENAICSSSVSSGVLANMQMNPSSISSN